VAYKMEFRVPVVEIDLAKVTCAEELHAALAQALAFPSFYGRNCGSEGGLCSATAFQMRHGTCQSALMTWQSNIRAGRRKWNARDGWTLPGRDPAGDGPSPHTQRNVPASRRGHGAMIATDVSSAAWPRSGR
jgi:hypothetical protein